MGIVRLVHSLRSIEHRQLWFVAKTTFVGSIVYYTVEQGLWSKPEDSVHLYAKIYNNITPYIKENIPKKMLNELPPLPSTSDFSNSVKSSWNKGVIASMKFLSETPTHLSNGMQSLTKLVQDYKKMQNVSEKSQ